MRTIIAGSRTILDYYKVERAVEESGFPITEVVSGHARGVDKLGELWARLHDVPVTIYPAEWEKYGKSAGYLRNQQMALNADALIAVYDGSSNGTRHMINIAKERGLKVYISGAEDGWHTS